MPRIENIIKFIFLVFIYSFPLGKLVGINSVSIIVLASIALFDLVPSIKQLDKSRLLLLSMPAILFIGYGISGLFSDNIHEGFFSLQVKLSLIVMPLIFISERIRLSIGRDLVFKHFVIAMALVMAYCISFNVIVRYWDIDNPFVKFRLWKDFGSTFANPTKTQSIYVGYFGSLALLIVIFQLFKSAEHKIFYLITGAVILLGLTLNGAKMATIAFVLLSMLQYILLINKRRRLIGIIGIAVLTCLMAGFASQNTYLKSRFSELAPSNWKIPMRGQDQNSVRLRLAILSCSADLLKEHWVKGIPAGDLQQKLNECYISKNYHEELVNFSFDNHNQYLNTWLSLGITGFIVLLTMLFGAIIYAIRNKDIMLLSFMILILLSFLTENIFSTQKGIVFFSFFYCLLIVTGFAKKPEPINL